MSRLMRRPTISRTSDRTRQLRGSIVATLIIKLAALAISFAAMPAYLTYLDNDATLGVWFTLLSVLAWALNFDLGVGNGLRQKSVQCLAKGQMGQLRSYISSSYAVSFSGALVFGTVGGVVVWAVNWNKFFNVSPRSVAPDELRLAVGVVAAGILLQIVLRLAVSLLFSLQRPAIPAFLSLTTNGLILAFLISSRSLDWGGALLDIAFVYVFAVNVPLVCVTIWLFGGSLKGCRPQLSSISFAFMREVLGVGIGFLGLQLLFMVFSTGNSVLIAWSIGADDVVDFQIYGRPFFAAVLVFSLGLSPVWSAVTKAIAEEDVAWILKLIRSLALATLIAACGLGVLALFMQDFVDLWLGGETIALDPVILVVFCLSSICFAWNAAISSIANGAGWIRIQSVLLSVGLAAKIPFAVLLARDTGDWVWVVASDVVGLLPYLVWITVVVHRRFGLKSLRA